MSIESIGGLAALLPASKSLGAGHGCRQGLHMKRALMVPHDQDCYNPRRKGKYRRRTDVRIGKPLKGKRRKVDS